MPSAFNQAIARLRYCFVLTIHNLEGPQGAAPAAPTRGPTESELEADLTDIEKEDLSKSWLVYYPNIHFPAKRMPSDQLVRMTYRQWRKYAAKTLLLEKSFRDWCAHKY